MKFFPLWWIADGACACPVGVECPNPGKHPLTHDGFKSATDDEAQLDEWEARWPLCHWAIATGALSGLVVVDLDIKPGKNGVESWERLQATHGTVPETRTVRTGSGGRHLYFTHPGVKVGNTQNKPARGIDVRGDGGYVVAPPSGHISGGSYELTVDCAPVELPVWFLNLLQPSESAPATPAVDRGYFPAASEAVLSAAREALESHGPAVEGNGGDAHTFRAAAILIHDFALTDSEAWPLLTDWNLTCAPPWSERDLRAKLAGGGKYGSAAFGCKRTMDALEQARKLIADWREAGTADAIAIVLAVSPVIERAPNKVSYSTIEQEMVAATGMTKRQMGLPAATGAQREEPGPGQIEITTRPHETANASLAAIADMVFCRNGVLCEVVKQERTFISDLEANRIFDLMSQTTVYVRQDTEKGLITASPPEKVSQILHSRRTLPGVRILEAVTTAPVFLADGSILQEKGYNAQARLWLEPSVTVDVAARPTQGDAIAAVGQFRILLQDFRFATSADFSAWLAGLLSPLVKAATGNAPAPLVCVSASSAGAGKTLLTSVIASIITGEPAEVRPYNPRDPSEWGKRLTAFVKSGAPVSVFDNVRVPLGDEGLDRLITSSTWSDRILGASDAPPLPNVSVWFANGNNLEIVGDTVRRALPCRIEVLDEKPQERTGFKQPLLAEYAKAHRAQLLSAALTILRAYHVAGRPSQGLASWGSFTAWSELVRGSLVWAGCEDPFVTQQRASSEMNEPDNDVHDFWISVVGASDGTPGKIADVANARDAQGLLGTRDAMSAHTLRKFVARFVDKPRAGKRIRKTGAAYTVETL